jgi:hypothetical protein
MRGQRHLLTAVALLGVSLAACGGDADDSADTGPRRSGEGSAAVSDPGADEADGSGGRDGVGIDVRDVRAGTAVVSFTP